MEKDIEKAIVTVVRFLYDAPVIRNAAVYLSPKLVVRAARRSQGKPMKGAGLEIVLKVGAPNFAQRAAIKAFVKAGEPFPVKKVQYKVYPVKKKA
jgi:hypothetical protein